MSRCFDWFATRGQGTEIGAFEIGLRSLIKRCNDAGARVILSTPSVIDEKHDGSNAMDRMLDEYSAVSRKVAMENGRNAAGSAGRISGKFERVQKV